MEENGKSGISAEIWPISSGHDDDKQLDNITVTVIDPNIVMIDDKMEKKLELENGKVEMEKKDSYIVEKGDTLIGISMKLNISVARLKKYNHLFGKNDVIVGQVCGDGEGGEGDGEERTTSSFDSFHNSLSRYYA